MDLYPRVELVWNNLPLYFPALLFKSFVNALTYGGFHEVHITNHLRSKGITKVLVELAVL